MRSVASDTIGGFNAFLDEQKRAPGTATLTLHQFDDVFETVIEAADIKAAPDLTRETFVPRGNTALLDAMGSAIDRTGTRLLLMREPDRPGKVVFVVITDGIENASRKYRADLVNQMIAHQRSKYGWEFVFLGANQDAITSAAQFGMSMANAMTYQHTGHGTQRAFAATSENLAKFRSGAKSAMDYELHQRAEQQQP